MLSMQRRAHNRYMALKYDLIATGPTVARMSRGLLQPDAVAHLENVIYHEVIHSTFDLRNGTGKWPKLALEHENL
jgi:hypothetical protein